MAEKIGFKVREIYNKVINDIGYGGAFKNKYQILIWDKKEDFLKFLKSQNINISFESSAVALYYWKGFPTILGYNSKYLLTNYLAHEFTHLILAEVLDTEGEKIPLWLNEGLASFEEQSFRKNKYRFLSNYIEQKNYIKLSQLININQYPKDDNQLKLFYIESEGLVDFLINKKSSKDTFYSFLRWYVIHKYSFEKSFLYAYGEYINFEEFEKKWLDYIKNKSN